MIELDVFYFHWLSTMTAPLANLRPGMRLIGNVETLALARVATEKFNDEAEPLTRGFPRTADKARGLLAAINAVLPPVGSPLLPDLSNKILTESEVQRIHAFHSAIFPTLRDESMHAYVLKFEDQRYLSSHTLVEKIESCFPPDCWNIIDKSAKREFGECGRCLCMERYTASGFHALRGVECVIRQYILALIGSLPRKQRMGHPRCGEDSFKGAFETYLPVFAGQNVKTIQPRRGGNELVSPRDNRSAPAGGGMFCGMHGSPLVIT